MRSKLKKTYRLTDKLFPGISDLCEVCKTCCETYGWLLEKEARRFSKRGFPVAKINNLLYCINSLKRNKKGKVVLNQIPRCIFYQKGNCSIYKLRPIDCRLFPIKVKFDNRQSFIGLSLGCKYISSLTKSELKKINKNIINFFKKAPEKIIAEYLNLMYQAYLISKPKKFWMKKLIEIKKKNGYWQMKKV